MSDTTTTGGPLLRLAVCRCCHLHDDAPHRTNEVVACAACGEACSCPGCVAEADPEGDTDE